jgi:hypothetical protein
LRWKRNSRPILANKQAGLVPKTENSLGDKEDKRTKSALVCKPRHPAEFKELLTICVRPQNTALNALQHVPPHPKLALPIVAQTEVENMIVPTEQRCQIALEERRNNLERRAWVISNC